LAFSNSAADTGASCNFFTSASKATSAQILARRENRRQVKQTGIFFQSAFELTLCATTCW
jgi:hypothetical protein